MRASSLAAVAVLAAAGCSRGGQQTAVLRDVVAADGAPSGPRGPLGTPTGIKVVDFHAHFDPRYPEAALRRMDEAGISVAMNFSGGSPRAVPYSIDTEKSSKGRLRFFCTIPWTHMEYSSDFVGDVVGYLGQCKSAGALGLKIPKVLGLGVPDPATGGLLAVDDPWLDPIFEEAARLDMPVAMHIGDPKAFFEPCTPDNERFEELSMGPEWCFADRTVFPAWEDLFAAFIRRVARHPRTTIVGVHFGNDPEEPLRVGRMMREHPNLWIDTASRIPEIGRRPPDEVRSVILEFPERVVFGSDLQIGPDMVVLGAGPPDVTQADVERFWRSTWRYFETSDGDIPSPTPIQGRWNVKGIELPRENLERLYHGNAERLLHLTAQ
jgi:predicted TIM-barrel fold metal-dependent hydrolase